MPTALAIINMGLGKIGASRISSITPARSPIERHCADGYEQWRDSELEKRVWAFALAYTKLTQAPENVDAAADGRRFVYPLPLDCLRPLRDPHTEWEQRGSSLYSAHDKLSIAYVRRAPEAEYPASFVDVLAARVGVECVEFATQSNTKEESINARYVMAVREAGKLNAFKVGPQNPTTPDDRDEWVAARMG